MFTEGHEGTVIVLRGNAIPSRPVSVFVHARLHTGAAALLRQGEFAADAEGQYYDLLYLFLYIFEPLCQYLFI